MFVEKIKFKRYCMAQQNLKKRTSHHQKLAHWLDDRFTVPGTNIRFGLDPVISLIPGAGDWLAGLFSSYFLLLGVRAEVPPAVLGRMGLNVILDVIIGSVPLLGDVFDVGWKANTKNAALLEEYRTDAAGTVKQSKGVLWAVALLMAMLIIAVLGLLAWAVTELFEALF